jgi:phosphohistidine phosphatase
MKCYFLRHGIAAERGEWEGSDFDRPLTDEGHARMAREAKAIAKFDLGIELILTSPLVRAKETAEIVAKALKLQERLVVDERLGLAFDRIRLEGMLREHRGAKALLLVGHEPGMSRTIGELVGGAAIDLKKGGLARVDLPDGGESRGALLWLVPPKILVAAS